MSFPGGFPLVGADRPSRSYATPPVPPVQSPPLTSAGGVRTRMRGRDGEEVIPRRPPRKNQHRPTQSTPNANASYFPTQIPSANPSNRFNTMYLAKAPLPAPITNQNPISSVSGANGVYENGRAMESGWTLQSGTAAGGSVNAVATSANASGALLNGIGTGGGGYRLGGGPTGPTPTANPDDLLVLPSMLPRGRSEGILPASSMQMQSLRPLGSNKQQARYHGPTLASPPIIMGTPGFGISTRDPRTGLSESERIKAAYLKAGTGVVEGAVKGVNAAGAGGRAADDAVDGGPVNAVDTPPVRKKKKKKIVRPAETDAAQQALPETVLPASQQRAPLRGSRSQAPQAQDAFLSWPGHTSLGVLIPNNPSSANLPLPLPIAPANAIAGNKHPRSSGRRTRTGANGQDAETAEERRVRIRERRERRQRRDAELAGAGVVTDGTGAVDAAGNTPRRSRTRRGTGDGMGEQETGAQGAGRVRLLRGASMRRANVWDGELRVAFIEWFDAIVRPTTEVGSLDPTEVPESNEQELPEGPPSFPYPTSSTTRLPPPYQQAPSHAAGRPISPPPSFATATATTTAPPDPVRQRGLETLDEGEEETENVTDRPESLLSETASSVVPDDEAPEQKRKRQLRSMWLEDVRSGIPLDERLRRDETRRHLLADFARTPETPAPLLARAASERAILGADAVANAPDAVTISDNSSHAILQVASTPATVEPAKPIQGEDDDRSVFRFSKEEKGKGRAMEVASIADASPATPRTLDDLNDRPVDMESLGETHGSGSDADFVSVKDGVESPVRIDTVIDLTDLETPRKSNGWRQVDAEEPSDEVEGQEVLQDVPLEVETMPAEEDKLEESVARRSPGTDGLFKGSPSPGTPSRTVPPITTSTSRPRGVSNASRISRNAAGSAFVEDLPEVTGAPVTTLISPISAPPTPPPKPAIAVAPEPLSPVGSPRPLFKRGPSDKAKNDNPWTFMRRASSNGSGGTAEPVLNVSPLAIESPKRPERSRKLSKLATQLFRPSLGLPAETASSSPEKVSTKTPSVASSDAAKPGAMLVDESQTVDIPSRLAALARRDLLAPAKPTPAVASDTASITTVPYIHPFNRAVRPAWMGGPAKFALPASLDPIPSRSYAPANSQDLEAKLGWNSSGPSLPVDHQFVPPPSWPIISEAVTARRRAPPPIPVKGSPPKNDSDSDDDSGSDSDDGSSSYEWSISEVAPAPRRSGGYRLLPPKGLPAEVLRGPAEPNPRYRAAGEERVRPRGPRDRGDPPPLPPRIGQAADGSAALAKPIQRAGPPPPPAPQAREDPPIEADWSVIESPLLRPPVERQLTANEKIMATLIPAEPQPKIRTPIAVTPPGLSGDQPPPPTKRKVSTGRARELGNATPSPPPPLRPGRLIIKPRFDDRPEQEMQSQLSKRVNKWRVMAIDAEVDNLIQAPEPDSEPESRPVARAAPPTITHSKSVPNMARLQMTRAADAYSPRPEVTASSPGPSPGPRPGPGPPIPHVEHPSAKAGPSTRKELEYTDLDLAVARAAEDGRDYEALGEVTAFVESAGRGATTDELADLLVAPVELESRRTTKDGKVKLKLAALGVRVTKCAICQLQYKEGHMLAMLPGCGHSGHQKCVVGWLRSDSRCMICRHPLRQ